MDTVKYSTNKTQQTVHEEIEIIRASIADEDRVFDYLVKHYYPDHPLYKNTLHKMEKEDCTSPIILKSNLSLLAVRKDDPETICGVNLYQNLGDFKGEMDALFEKRLKKYHGTPFGRASQLLRENGIVLSKLVAEHCWKGVDKKDTIKSCIMSVRREYRKKDVASTLGHHAMEMARKNNIRWIVAESVGYASLQMGLKDGFKVLSEIKYNDYFKDRNGNINVRIEPPDTAIVNLVKDLSLTQSGEAVSAKL